ncbi:MAG: (Fe-S)-binding protein [Myxococcota bacterium]
MNAIAMTLILVSTLSFFSWSAARRWRQIKLGVPDARFQWNLAEIARRTGKVLIVALGQQKMVEKKRYGIAGLAHVVIFLAFQVLLLNSILLWGRGYSENWNFFFGLLNEEHIVGQLYSLAKELAAAGCVVGVLAFLYLRVGKKGHNQADPSVTGDKPRMTVGFEPKLILFIIGSMMVADFLYVGGREALLWQAAGTDAHFVWYQPVGSVLALALDGASRSTLTTIEHIGFWYHAAWVLLFLNILPYTKHFHIITVIPNVFFYDPRPNALPRIDDLEGRVEREESLGVKTIADLNYKHISDLYTCTECGRCSDNCPAYITNKKLSPKHLTLALRDHLYASEESTFGGADGVDATIGPIHAIEEGEEIHTNPKPPEGAYFLKTEAGVEILPHILHPDVIWSCTSCRACEEQCPVMISYVDKIVGMRREEVMMKSEFPPLLQKALNGIETNGNPWNESAMDRAVWSEGLEIPTIEDHPTAQVLYWVGCAAAYDERAQKVARSFSMLLREAGEDFAILGTSESCTGDPARRIGHEYLFTMMAEQNIETLNGAGFGDQKKTIVTACPHCFNSLLNEYPDFGGHYDVVHHTDYLQGLLVAGKLKPTKPVDATVVYHDSCYLGRYNKVYDSPRQVLQSIEGVKLEEVDYWNKQQGLCCGAGGAQYFMEETNHESVPAKRSLQLYDTGADTVASACPFCMSMITTGLMAHEKDEEMRRLDVAELLAEAIDFKVALPAAAE